MCIYILIYIDRCHIYNMYVYIYIYIDRCHIYIMYVYIYIDRCHIIFVCLDTWTLINMKTNQYEHLTLRRVMWFCPMFCLWVVLQKPKLVWSQIMTSFSNRPVGWSALLFPEPMVFQGRITVQFLRFLLVSGLIIKMLLVWFLDDPTISCILYLKSRSLGESL